MNELTASLRAAGLPELATLAMKRLSDPREMADGEVRAAARAALMAAAESGENALAEDALLQIDLEPAELAAHRPLAVKLARAHLEAALLQKPMIEGDSFETSGTAADPVLPEGPVATAALTPPDTHAARANEELARAQKLVAAVPTGSAEGPAAREVAGLAALAAGDELTAEKEFGTLVGTPDGKGGRSQKALLQLARLAYARGDDGRAARLYAQVGRGASEWLDALFEASWAHFRRGEDERVLGNILTLQAPFFQGRFFPEAFVLQALVLYENCRYADARRALGRLEAIFKPRHDGLSAAIAALDALPPPADALGENLPPIEAKLYPQARAELHRAATSADLVASHGAVVAMTAELDSFDSRPALRNTALAAALLPDLRSTRLTMLTAGSVTLRARLQAERGELRELLGQSLRLSYEISGRERDQATDPSARATARPPKSPDVEDDEVMWPFQGEYWRDELGSYRFSLGARCTPAPRFKRTSATSAAR